MDIPELLNKTGGGMLGDLLGDGSGQVRGIWGPFVGMLRNVGPLNNLVEYQIGFPCRASLFRALVTGVIIIVCLIVG